MGMGGIGLREGVTRKLHNETDNGCPQECNGDCDEMKRENGAKKCPNGGTHTGRYDAIILDKGERSQAVKSYSDVTRGDVETPLGKNLLIISYIIYFIKVCLH